MARTATRLEGGRELRDLMAELPKRVRTKALRQGVTAAAAPVVKATKANVRRESGLLKKSITRKVKTYRGGNVAVAVVGSNRNVQGEWKGKKRVPANYFHLVEGNPGNTHALANAEAANRAQAGQIMTEKMQSVLEAEARKLANA